MKINARSDQQVTLNNKNIGEVQEFEERNGERQKRNNMDPNGQPRRFRLCR